jgi:hypothetical protein
MVSRRCFLILGVAAAAMPAPAWPQGDATPEWLAGPALGTVQGRFPPPAGFRRMALPDASFAAWLRQLPLRPSGEPVRYYDGRIRPDQSGVAAIVDIDVGRTDLQQCADAVIRLRAEYLRAAARLTELAFHFTSGDLYTYAAWLAGRRPLVSGNRVAWTSVGARPDTRRGFRAWLDVIFTYAGTQSLSRALVPVHDVRTVQPGDVLIQPGNPGHAVLVVDAAANAAGARRVLLAQSFMPAQNIHVLNNPAGGAWYDLAGAPAIATPDWTFAPADLRRFPQP